MTTAPAPDLNIALALNVLHLVEDHEEDGLWDQRGWVVPPEGVDLPPVEQATEICGTAGCLAGWVTFSDGYTSIGRLGGSWRNVMAVVHPDTQVPLATDLHAREGVGTIRDYARDRLGLTSNQADTLFESSNTIADLRRIVESYIDRARTAAA